MMGFFFLWLGSKGQFVNVWGEGGPRVIILAKNFKRIQKIYIHIIINEQLRPCLYLTLIDTTISTSFIY